MRLLLLFQFIPGEVSLIHHSALNSFLFQRFGFNFSASPEPREKKQGCMQENTSASSGAETQKFDGNAKLSGQYKGSVSRESKELGSNSHPSMSQTVKRRKRGTKRTAFSDSDSETEKKLSRDDLVKLVREKEKLLKAKHKEIEALQDKFLQSFSEMENVMERTKREADNSKKFAIQNFAKSLLDVADNLGRASSVVKASFPKIDTSIDTAALAMLKTLLEGVEMTDRQLAEVFKKYGVEKYDPTKEPFDPHRHNAAFQISDASKLSGTVAAVLKPGYMLHGQVIRPAEVGVVQEVENDTEA